MCVFCVHSIHEGRTQRSALLRKTRKGVMMANLIVVETAVCTGAHKSFLPDCLHMKCMLVMEL